MSSTRIGEIECRRIDTKYLVPRENSDYIDIGLLGLMDKLAFGSSLILKGPKGSGKTLAIEQWASLRGIPIMRKDCTATTGERDLVGTFSMQGDEVFFMLGTLTAAIEIANEQGACIIVLEEINTLDPEMQKILNPMTDYRKEVNVTKIGRSFRAIGDAAVWVIGTMNPSYGGTYDLNEELRSRFEFVEVGYMPEKEEKRLLHGRFPSTPNAAERRVIDRLMTLAQETRSNNMAYALSTRDLVQFVDNMMRLGTADLALKMLEGKYESDHVANFRARVKSTFSMELSEVELFSAPL